MDFARNLKTLRRVRGMTQEQLADRLGVQRSTVTQWEVGRSVPRLDRIHELAEALGVGVGSLITDDILGEATGIRMESPGVWSQAAADGEPDGFAFDGVGLDSVEVVVADWSMGMVVPKGAVVTYAASLAAESGDVAAVSVDGGPVTLRRVYEVGNTVVLHAEPVGAPVRDVAVDVAEGDGSRIRILGRVTAYRSPEGWRP